MTAGSRGEINIQVENLSKAYRLYGRPLDVVREVLTRRCLHTEAWSLLDVSFEVAKGEVLGIIGRNGAGKSTLLKIIAGTLDPTSGRALVRGKVSAILELGTGFHPEYTGRENIVVGGLCLGMTRAEVERKEEEIIAFSELAGVIDRPFKTYSSGMKARLTFSTALSVEPDVLIIDEALAVGDMLFQEKCLNKLKEIRARGTTVLLVTHSLQYIYEICDRCILLANGSVVAEGAPREVGDVYERMLVAERQQASAAVPVVEKTPEPTGLAQESPDSAGSGMLARIVSLDVTDTDGAPVATLRQGRNYAVVARIDCLQDVDGLNVGFRLQRTTGVVVTGETTDGKGVMISGRAGDLLQVSFHYTCRLTPGSYILGGGVTQLREFGSFDVLDLVRGARVIEVIGRSLNGLVEPDCRVEVRATSQPRERALEAS